MKKTLIAVAALAATSAFAQNVTISGTFDATYRMSSWDLVGNANTYKATGLGKDGIGTSGVVLSGNEDLGGGLKAIFLLEKNFDPSNTGTEGTSSATGSVDSTGQVFVGLQGAFGAIKLGAPNTPHLTVQSAGRGGAFGTKDGGRASLIPGVAMMGLSLTRYDSTVQYESPNFSGFSFMANYVAATEAATITGSVVTEGNKSGSAMDIGAFYSNGPIAAGVAVYSLDESKTPAGAAVAPGKTSQTSFYGSYNFGMAKVSLGGHMYEVKAPSTVVDNSGLNVNVDVPLSPALTLSANIQSLDDKTVANIDATQTAIGAQYAMSKRTTAYARYIKQSADNVVTTNASKDADRFLVGLRHNF